MHPLPPLTLAPWRATRDTLRGYGLLLGKIRRALAPPQKHWWHITLRAGVSGLTTTPLPVGGRSLELTLDLLRHRLAIATSSGEAIEIPLHGQSPAEFHRTVVEALALLGLHPPVDAEPFRSEAPGTYDSEAVARYWQALNWVDTLFRRFRAGLREETSPVQLFPHHFDLAVNWFSGRRVPDTDPADPEWSDEQMNFGFLTGDDALPEPYFYATAYPQPAAFTELDPPPGARWQSEGWTGLVLPYARLLETSAPEARLLEFLQRAQRHGAALMSSP